MAKYIIDIPDDGQCQYGYNEDTKELKFQCPRLDPNSFMGLDITISGVTPYTEPDRKAIEAEVWEFARGLLNYTDDDWEVITNMLLLDIPYQEAKAKYDEWRKKKEEIRVGDEIKLKTSQRKGTVISEGTEYVRVLFEDADYPFISAWERKNIIKTGRHFDEMEKLLERMRE